MLFFTHKFVRTVHIQGLLLSPLNSCGPLCQHLADTAQAHIFHDIFDINATKRGGHIYALKERDI